MYAAEDDKDERIEVLSNDFPRVDAIDPDTLTIVTPPQHAASFRVHNDHIHYQSVRNYNGVDTIVYSICDTGGACSTATLTINVNV